MDLYNHLYNHLDKQKEIVQDLLIWFSLMPEYFF